MSDETALAVIPKSSSLIGMDERQVAITETGADPLTGLVTPRAAPGAKLTADGLRRLREIIIEGECHSDDEIADKMVAEGYVTSYTGRAVGYWRRHRDTITLMNARQSAQLMVGFANVNYRVKKMNQMAHGMMNKVFVATPDGNLAVRETEGAADRLAQASMMGQLNKLIDQIGNTVDIKGPAQLNVTGSVVHSVASSLGLTGSAEEMSAKVKAMLAEAADEVIDVEFQVLPDTIGSSLRNKNHTPPPE